MSIMLPDSSIFQKVKEENEQGAKKQNCHISQIPHFFSKSQDT